MNEPVSTDDVWTVQRILTWTTDFLAKGGIESARLEAELLCAHARQCQRIRLYTDFDVPMTDVEREGRWPRVVGQDAGVAGPLPLPAVPRPSRVAALEAAHYEWCRG